MMNPNDSTPQRVSPATSLPPRPARGFTAIRAWLIDALASAVETPASEIDPRTPFASYGLPSREAVILSGDLQDWLGRPLSPTLLYEFPTIDSLAAHLGNEMQPEQANAAPLADKQLSSREPIAIVGMSCRFPGARSVGEFWRLLRDGQDAISEVPGERWNVDDFYDPNPAAPGKINTRWGGFLNQIDRFDAAFFGISPREAVFMDPQQRLLLHSAWEALEDAGIRASTLSGQPVGVYVGISGNEYAQAFHNNPMGIDAYSGTGNALSVAANRLSYFFNFSGPSIALDTACSSSLVAVYLACQGIWMGQTSLALAGGANLILSPTVTVNFTKARAMAADGRCKAFDSRADGYVRGEGVGVVVLKPLSQALADRNEIYAVIRGGAVNQDGRTNGLMAPSCEAQQSVIRAACRSAQISPGEIQYFETHGTGTVLGDAIEARALAGVLQLYRAASEPCLIGSVKTNIGHLEAAAGVAALIKTALSLKHGSIPPSLHFQHPNPEIPFDELPIRVVDSDSGWDNSKPLLAGVSSFGFGGTNAHLILESAPAIASPAAALEPKYSVLPISARAPEALADLATAYLSLLDDCARPLSEICAGAALLRDHHDYRLAIAAQSTADCARILRAHLAGEAATGLSRGRVEQARSRRLTFVFPDHGAEWDGMEKSLYESHPAFRETIESCDALILRQAQWSLIEEFFTASQPALPRTAEFVHPAVFSMQLALAELWRSWGVEPASVIGYGMGEVAAACFSGCLSIEDVMRVICQRSRLLARCEGQGARALVDMPYDDARKLIAGCAEEVSISAVNGPDSTVLSGSPQRLNEIINRVMASGIFAQLLDSHGAPSRLLIDPLRSELQASLAGIESVSGAIPFYSTVTGNCLDGTALSPEYWGRNLSEIVLFSRSIETNLADGATAFVEISQQPQLLSSIQRHLPSRAQNILALPSLRRDEPQEFTLAQTLGALYCSGHLNRWDDLFAIGSAKVKPPLYPFQCESYWTGDRLHAEKGGKSESAEQDSVWNRLRAAGLEAADKWPFDLKLQSEPARNMTLDEISTAAVVNALRSLGAFAESGDTHTVASLIEQYGILPVYAKLMERWLARLLRAGFVTQSGDRFTCVKPLPVMDIEPLWQLAGERHGLDSTLLGYLRRSANSLASVLSGAVSPLDLMFPGGSLEITESLYRLSPEARYYNGIAASLVRTLANAWRSAEPLRILEIGAGTGGTTASLLPALPGTGFEYAFTDVTPFFLHKAQREFAAYPFVTYRTLDIEKDPGAQGIQPASFDLVIAANVLHATRDLDVTLGNVRSLLKPQGLLLIWEVTEQLTWFDISFGLIEGWQRYEDALRSSGPLLSTESWSQALRQHRFDAVESFPPANSPASVLKQHIVLAGTGDAIFSRAVPPTYATEVSLYYDQLSRNSRAASGELAFDETYLTFAPLPQIVSGFSWLLALYESAEQSGHSRRAREAQKELRRLVFRQVDFHRVHRALDFGCGYSADILALAAQFPYIKIDGYTISSEQADVGYRKVRQAGLQDRLRIFNRDSASDRFPNRYDLVFGFEVAGHIQDKDRLFANISQAMNEGAQLVMADFAANTLSSVSVADTGAYTITLQQWAEVLANHHLLLTGSVDISQEVAHFLYDPDFDGNLDRLAKEHSVDELVVKNLKSYKNIGRILERGLMSYLLLTVEKCASRPVAELTALNNSCLSRPESYATSLLQLANASPALAAAEADAAVKGLCYEMQWRPIAQPNIDQPAAATWLILADRSGTGEALARHLRAQSVHCITAFRGAKFARLAEDSYTLPAADPDACAELLRSVGSTPLEVIHLWSLDSEFAESLSLAQLEQGQASGVATALVLAQAMLRMENQAESYIWFLTRGSQQTSAQDAPQAIDQAPLWGLGRVIATEYPKQWGGLIDLDPAAGADEMAERICQLVNHRGRENQLVLRAGQIFVPRLATVDADRAGRAHLRCRADCSYLITGGLGALGLLVARRLAERGARRILLLGRRPLPSRAHWKSIDQLSPVGLQIGAVRAIEALGASVHILSADIADEARVSEVLDRYVDESWPPIRGVVHAAGLVEGRTLLELDLPSLAEVLAPKLRGSWILHRYFEDKPLDFFVLFSSASSLLGPPGQGNYAAANAFLDGLAHYRHSLGLPATSINWGPWQAVGEAARALVDRIEDLGMGSLAAEPALQAFEMLLGNGIAQAAVLPGHLNRWFSAMPSVAASPLLALIADGRSQEPDARLAAIPAIRREEIFAADPERREALVEDYVAALIANILRFPLERLDRAVLLSNLGVDSLIAVEIKNQIEVELGITIPVVKLLKGPSVSSLSADILSLLDAPQAASCEEIPVASISVAAVADPERSALREIGELSDEDMESLLTKLSHSDVNL
jgi:acyl transferase domain-containing protein/SAM-dependent methyltransferase/acyl carrier protein